MSDAPGPGDFDNAKAALQHSLNHRQMQLKWSLHNIQKAKDSCQSWNELQHEAVLLQANLYRCQKGQALLTVEDWAHENQPHQIKLDPRKTASEQIAERANKSKRMQRGLQTLEEKQTKIENKLIAIQSALNELALLNSMETLRQFENRTLPKREAKSAETKKLPYRTFCSAAGLPIFVGKGAKGNAIVSFQLASGSDTWCHVQGCPGAHVLLKVNKGKQPDPESVQDALLLALIYSKGESQGKAEVLITQAKYIRPIGKKELGKVQVSKHSLCLVERDLNRFQAIKERGSSSQAIKEPGGGI